MDKLSANLIPNVLNGKLNQTMIIASQNHDDLQHLDYEHSGHTGFASAEQVILLLPKDISVLPKNDLTNRNAKIYIYDPSLSTQETQVSVEDLLGSKIKTVQSVPDNLQTNDYIFLEVKGNADTTKKYKIQQKQADGMLTLHPETDADIVILDNAAAGMSATNVQDAFKEIMGIIDELRGGGLDINGAINEYVVNAGATVNAGDFVEFIQGIVNQGTFNNGNVSNTSAVALNNSQVLVAYADGGNSYYGTAVVLTISGTTISAGNKTVFNNGTTANISAVALSDSQVLVAYSDTSNSSYGTAVVLTINGTTISAGNKTVFNNGSTTYTSAVALNNSQVLVAYANGNSNYGTAVVLTISGTTISVGNNKPVFSSRRTSYISAVALNNNTVLVAYRDRSNFNYGTAVILTIRGTTISVGNKTVFSSRNTVYISAAALSDSQVLVAYADLAEPRYGITVVLTINGTTISAGTETVFNSRRTDFTSAVALSDSQVLVAYRDGSNSYYGTAVVLTINGTTISVGNKTVFNNGRTSSTSAVALSDSQVLVAYSDGGDILGDYALIGEVIQPATTRDGYVGVAKTSGTAGQTVEVYDVPLSYAVTVSKTNCTNTSGYKPDETERNADHNL